MTKILIVEDNESIRMAYARFLEQEGYEVIATSRVSEALEYLAGNTPNLILLDMLMPEMNGLELLRQYDILNAHREVKVLAFSNLGENLIEKEALALGVNLYMTKSLTTPKVLIENIKGLLAI